MFTPRPFQQTAIDYAVETVTGAHRRKPILCSPTGSGKTVIAAFIAKELLDRGYRGGFMSPREEITFQNLEATRAIIGDHRIGILKAGEQWDRHAPMHIISWPTLVARTGRKNGGEAWYPDIDFLLIDECHLAVTPRMVERVLPYYQNRMVVGLTATPARNSGRGLGSYFDEIKHVTSVRQLIADGYLAACDYWGGKLIDVEGVRTRAGDFDQKQLAKRSAKRVGDVVANWLRLAKDRHTIVFAANVADCEALTERFVKSGISAMPLHIHMTPDRRQRTVEAFKARQVQVLVNVTMASYGFDAPTVDCVVLARPTQSIVLHLQMIGRGMRIAKGKEFCMVIDHADNVRRLGQADDLYRWRLSKSSQAAGNWTRDKRNPKAEKPEATKTHVCEECWKQFQRSLECPECGWRVPLPKQEVDFVDADLVRIAKTKGKTITERFPADDVVYSMLLGWRIRRGYKQGWVTYKYKELYGKWPPWSYQKDLRPIEPSPIVRNWLIKRAKAYRKQKTA